MGAKLLAMFFVCMLCMLNALPPAYAWQQNFPPSYPTPHHRTPSVPTPSLPQHGGETPPPVVLPQISNPPVIVPPIIPPITTPPVTRPPPSSSYPPYTPPGGGGGTLPSICPPPPSISTPPPPSINPPPAATCDAFKLGFCLDVLGGLVHVVIGNPVENLCCPVIQGLLEQEAAMCLCTTIRLKFLNLNIFLPLAFQVMTTCGLTPPPDFVCPAP